MVDRAIEVSCIVRKLRHGLLARQCLIPLCIIRSQPVVIIGALYTTDYRLHKACFYLLLEDSVDFLIDSFLLWT